MKARKRKTNRSNAMRQTIANIHSRNSRVEADKAWETSWTRRLLIAVTTYVLASLLLVWISAPQPFLAALVPTLGYVLSTLTLRFAKQRWLESGKRKL